MTPDEILRENRRRAQLHAQEVGVARLRKLLEAAQDDLNGRIIRAEGLRGPGRDSFTAVRARMVLAQVKDVLRGLTGSMRDLVVDQAVDASEAQTASVLAYLAQGERLFTGSAQPLGISQAAMLDHVRQGAESSALRRIVSDPNQRGHRGVLDRYGENVIGKFEDALQQRALTGKPWAEVRDDLVKESPFLQQAPAHWAERIVRTEVLAGQNRASQEAMTSANDQLGGGMLKILCAAFDGRTAADSYAVHGQIRRVSEPFNDWTHAYMAPPNRPNDRETVVPHRIHWPVPVTLKPKSDGEVAARWSAEGRKGSPPARPLMSTVDMAALAAEEVARTEEREKPAEPKAPRAPKPPPAPKGGVWAPPSLLTPTLTVTRKTDERGSREEVRDSDGNLHAITQDQQAAFDRIHLLANLANPKEIDLGALVQGAVVDARPAYLKPLKKALESPEKIREASELKLLKRDDLAKVKFGSPTLDADVAKSFAAHDYSLHLKRAVVVRYRGELHVHDGAELLFAQKMSGGQSRDIDVDFVDLDVVDPPTIVDKAKWRTDLKRGLDGVLRGESGTSVRERMKEIIGTSGVPARDATRGYGLKFGAELEATAALSTAPSSADIGGAVGVHNWDGSVKVVKSYLESTARALAMDPAALRALPIREQHLALHGLQVLVHEELHGASKIRSIAYNGAGIGIEEAATEILARKIVREHFEEPALYKLPDKANNYDEYSGYGAYQRYISGLLSAVDHAYGDGADVGARVEEACLKTRKWKAGEREISDGKVQIDEFVDALQGLPPAKRKALKVRLKALDGPLAPRPP